MASKTTSESVKLDQIDLSILSVLQTSGRITNQDLADVVGLSASPCLQRVKRLEQAGIIQGYRAHIEMSLVCRHIDVIAAVTLKAHDVEEFDGFENLISNMRFVVECIKVSGNIDYLVRFVCPDIASYQMMSDELLRLGPRIANLSSYVVLKTAKPFQGIALDELVSHERGGRR